MNNDKALKQLEEIDLGHPLVTAYLTLNKEMGVVQGELKWIKILMAATTASVFGQLMFSIFGG